MPFFVVQQPSISNAKATVLLVGDGEPLTDAVVDALRRYSVVVERGAAKDLLQSVMVAAPDLVLLCGDAVADRGREALEKLAEDAVASVAPVALLLDDASLDERLRAFRSGAVAVIARGGSADAIAKRISDLCSEMPDRPGEATGELGEATLDELAELIAHKLRSGILSVEQAGDKPPMRVVLGSGGGVAAALDQFVEQLRPLIADAEPLRYELFEASGGRMQLWDDAAEGEGDAIYEDLRIVIMDDDPARADEFALALRDRGALVAVTGVSKRGILRARQLDPAVIVLDALAIEGEGFEIVRKIRRDPRLRWASLLVAKWNELWPEGMAAPDLERVSSRLMPLVSQDRSLSERCRGKEPFDTRLELTGPSRMLRAVAAVEGSRVVATRSARVAVDVDLTDGLLVSAQGLVDGRDVVGTEALMGLLTLGSGRVRIERRTHPAAANVMLPVDEALDAAILPTSAASAVPPALIASDRPSERPSERPSRPARPSARSEGLQSPPPPRSSSSRGLRAPSASPHIDDTKSQSTKAPPPGYRAPKGDAGSAKPKAAKRAKLKTQMGIGGYSLPAPSKMPTPATGLNPSDFALPRSSAPPPAVVPKADDADSDFGLSAFVEHNTDDVGSALTRPAPAAAKVEMSAELEPPAALPSSPPDRARALLGSVPPPPKFDIADGSSDRFELGDEDVMSVRPPPPPAFGGRSPQPAPGAPEVQSPAAEPPSLPPAAAADDRGEDELPATADDWADDGLEIDVVDDGLRSAPVMVSMQPTAPGSSDLDTLPPIPKSNMMKWLAIPVVLALLGGAALAVVVSKPGWFGTAETPIVSTPIEDATAENGAPENTAPEDTAPENTAPENTAPENAAPENAAPENAAPENAAPENAAPENTAPENAAPENAAPENAAPENAAPVDVSGLSDRERGRLSDAAARDAERAAAAGNLDAAMRLAAQAIEYEERNPQALAAQARVHLARGDHPAAIDWARRATRRRSRRASYQVLLGDALRASGNAAEANAAFRRALELDPDNRDARARLR